MKATIPASMKLPKLIAANNDSTVGLGECKDYLADGQDLLEKAFFDKVSVRHLVAARAAIVDQLLVHLWRQFLGPNASCACMVAVGGYGRSELHPYSDIDILILLDKKPTDKLNQCVQQLITFLWDCGLDIGHSVRTLNQTKQAALEDVSVITNLTEARFLTGQPELFSDLTELVAPKSMWPSYEFYQAKVLEQKQRYKKYRGTSFDLEPNIKGSPGGLRDLQLVGWISKRHFNAESLHALATQGIFTLQEYRTLISSQLYLWRVRFALHIAAGRSEDRLLFQHQKKVAELLELQDCSASLGVEKLMKRYFRAASRVRNITELLIQLFAEEILEKDKRVEIISIDEHYQLENGRIALINPEAIAEHPEWLIQTFIVAATTAANRKISARTLRAIRDHRYLIDDDYRNNPKYKQLFLTLFSIKHESDRPLFLFKRHGLLAEFLPLFEQISGQMQFDMFHAFTVDEHTLFLIKNLTRFNNPEYAEELPLCSQIMQNLDNPQIIYLAGLFHDIAKGRGGDHSELGAIDAYNFCKGLGLPNEQASTVAWLVQCHLIMSVTAQRKDISDPQVITTFAQQVKTVERLQLLYILTVADIRATSPKLWNSWKDALLRELFVATKQAIQQEQSTNEESHAQNKSIRQRALELLLENKVPKSEIEKLWSTLPEIYFETTPMERIVWQTTSVIKHAHSIKPLVEIKRHYNDGGTEIFIYTSDQPGLFAAITATLSQKNLRTQAADLTTNTQGKCFDSFVVLEEDGEPINSTARVQSIRKLLQKRLKNIDGISKKVERHISSRLRQFDVPTEIRFSEHQDRPHTMIELIALDQPGLLAAIGEAFSSCGISVISARIVTLGEKVEDSFEVFTTDSNALNKDQQQRLHNAILKNLKNL